MSRRWLSVIVLIAGVVGLVACATPAKPSWPQFRGGSGTGVAAGPTAISKATITNLTLDFTAALGDAPGYLQSIPQPAVVNGRVYAMSPGTLRVFDAAGKAGCGGAPKSCEPLWTAALFGPGGGSPQQGRLQSTPAVVGPYVLVMSEDGFHSKIEAFDAAGVSGCTGTPRTCVPLWSTPELGLSNHPIIANGLVYAADTLQRVAAFDVNGIQGCSGSPAVCEPMWSSSLGTYAQLAVADGVLVATPYPTVDQYSFPERLRTFAYDALGQQGCTGTPKVCDPLWRTEPLDGGDSSSDINGYPVIVNGRVYVYTYTGYPSPGVTEIRVYDLQGGASCTGVPATCAPLWVNRFPPGTYSFAANKMNGPAVANGVLYAYTNVGSSAPPNYSNQLAAFDADGLDGCGGTPIVCSPLWYASYAAAYPVVANGVLFAGTRAFDAAGNDNCDGSPKVCAPLWQDASVLYAESAVAEDRVFSVVQANVGAQLSLRVYRLP